MKNIQSTCLIILTLSLIMTLPFSNKSFSENIGEHKTLKDQELYIIDERLPDLLNIKGRSYHEARNLLQQAGWQPVKNKNPNQSNFEGEDLQSNLKAFSRKGYHELLNCRTEEMYECSFLFINAHNDTLKIVTQGLESENEDEYNFAVVSGYQMTTMNPFEEEQGYRPPNPSGAYGYDVSLPEVLNIRNQTYHEARSAIMALGWMPYITNTDEKSEEFEMNIGAGTGEIFWALGYHELQYCSGTGNGHCMMMFENKLGAQLSVVTKFAESLNPSISALVAGYRMGPKSD